MEEQILAVETALFHSLGCFQGFCSDVERYRSVLLAPENIRVLPRSAAETNPAFKQLIPYMFFCYKNESGDTQLFQYVRGKGAGEQRLRSKRSIGVGGHLNSSDGAIREPATVSPFDATNEPATVFRSFNDAREPATVSPYLSGMLRELNEEVVLDTRYTEQCVGLINDDSTEVGRVHLGIVHRFDVLEPNVRSNEPDLIESGFVSVTEMLRDLSGFESWSSICIEALFSNR